MQIFDANRLVVDLLVADVSLPDGNGCALAIEMRRHRPDLRVLFVSFHVGAEICKYYGIDAPEYQFLKKPFDERALLSRVRRTLGGADQPKWNTASAAPSMGEE
jgi:DNA-binding response OmpR family regulator